VRGVKDNNPFRLLPGIAPTHYELLLQPHLEEASFDGEVSIDVTIAIELSCLELNASRLEVRGASIVTQESGGIPLELAVATDEEHEIVRLTANTALQPGRYRISMTFSGVLDDDLAGFYRSSYRDEEGQEHFIATTQFESTDARRAFPCFDEPDLKATFAVTLDAPLGLMAISNYPEVSTTVLDDGRTQRVKFQTTMTMSTYLLAFIVGRLEATSPSNDSGVPLRIVAVPEKMHLTKFAQKVGTHALQFFAEWFSIPYPAPKLDMIALPDFAAGAMENLGAVTYREAVLLIDEDHASKAELERVTDVICHELAHMWFGDLVTMKWWNGIWLNEAFATYMELLACDAYNPSWKRWESFGMSRLAALDVDGLPSTRPIEYEVVAPNDAEDMFDLLTYEKGASVLRMLETYLGTDRFREGVKHYLDTYAYSNAETSDLWRALAERSGLPIEETMTSWVFQGGHPVISASLDNNVLTLSQTPFRFLGRDEDDLGSIGSHWIVPVPLQVGDQLEHHLLSDSTTTVTIEDPSSTVIVNAGGTGVFRTRYDATLFSRITTNYSRLTVLERFNLISDTWALVLAEQEDLRTYASLTTSSSSERDPNVLKLISSSMSLVHRIAASDEQEVVAEWARRVFQPIIDELGYEPSDHETQESGLDRAIALEALGTFAHDPLVLEFALEQFRRDMSGVQTISPDLASSILTIVAKHGDDTEFAFVLDRYRHPRDPQDQLRNLYALAQFGSRQLLVRVFEMAKEEIRIQDAYGVISRLVANPTAGIDLFRLAADNWEFLTHRFPPRAHVGMLTSVPTLCGERSAAHSLEIISFIEAHPPITGGRLLAQTLERYRLNLRFRDTYNGHLSSIIA
jgi:puromycin-sensitive aminopeptidase